jgi:hypothetical protein
MENLNFSNPELNPELANSQNVININDFKRHEENKLFKHIQTPKKAVNMTQYLSKYGEKINSLSQYNIDIDEIKINNKYKYDKIFKTEKEINNAVIKLIIDMYYNIEDKKRLRLKINYLIENQFKHPFILIEENDETGTFYSIYHLFQYIKRTIKGKSGDKLFNKVKDFKCEYISRIKAVPLKQNFNCPVCLEDIENNYILNYNCDCKDIICKGCFEKLPNPKKCTTCRKKDYSMNMIIAEDTPAKRRFTIKYNNSIYTEDIEFGILENETLFYYNIEKKKIEYFSYKLKTDEDLLNEIVECDDKFFDVCAYRLSIFYQQSHSNTTLNSKSLQVLQNHYYEDGDYAEYIGNVLGLNDNEERLEFIDEYYRIYGIEKMSDQIEEQFKDTIDYKNVTYNIIVDFYEGWGENFNDYFHL